MIILATMIISDNGHLIHGCSENYLNRAYHPRKCPTCADIASKSYFYLIWPLQRDGRISQNRSARDCDLDPVSLVDLGVVGRNHWQTARIFEIFGFTCRLAIGRRWASFVGFSLLPEQACGPHLSDQELRRHKLIWCGGS